MRGNRRSIPASSTYSRYRDNLLVSNSKKRWHKAHHIPLRHALALLNISSASLTGAPENNVRTGETTWRGDAVADAGAGRGLTKRRWAEAGGR